MDGSTDKQIDKDDIQIDEELDRSLDDRWIDHEVRRNCCVPCKHFFPIFPHFNITGTDSSILFCCSKASNIYIYIHIHVYLFTVYTYTCKYPYTYTYIYSLHILHTHIWLVGLTILKHQSVGVIIPKIWTNKSHV